MYNIFNTFMHNCKQVDVSFNINISVLSNVSTDRLIYIYIYVAVCSVNWIAIYLTGPSSMFFFSQMFNTGCNTAVSTNQPGPAPSTVQPRPTTPQPIPSTAQPRPASTPTPSCSGKIHSLWIFYRTVCA